MAYGKEPEGPSMIAVVILGALTFIMGGALGLASLISQSVVVLNKEPEPGAIEPGTVYFIRGERIGRTAWRAKEDAWKSGLVQELSLSEAELNQWSQDRLNIDHEIPPEERDSWRNRLKLEIDPVNFRILDSEIQMATTVQFMGLFEGKTFHCQFFGFFLSTPDGVYFVPERGTIGLAALGYVPVVRDWIIQAAAGKFRESLDLAWLEESLANMEYIDLSEGEMILKRRSGG
ncbi:MAG: hypothetical protein ACP5I4_04190 [Oceanipulchritudo sp.]